MQEIGVAWQALKYGGAMVYPLLALGVLAIAIIIDRARALCAMPAAARGSCRPGRDVRIFVGRAGKAVEGTRTAQRLRAFPASDRRQSPSARVVGRIASGRRGGPNRKDARARTMGARDDRHWRAAARTARHYHGHDAVVQRDRMRRPWSRRRK